MDTALLLKNKIYLSIDLPLGVRGLQRVEKKKNWKKTKSKTAKEVFYALAPFHLEERLVVVCVQRTLSTRLFHSAMLVSVEC